MLAVTGYRTTIVKELKKLIKEEVVWMPWSPMELGMAANPMKFDRYLFAAGVLHQKKIQDQTEEEMLDSVKANFLGVVRRCEVIFDANPKARICVIGSESGFKGSFDMTYALSKAALHTYVEMKRLKPQQQLFAIAPPIISDSGMTERRDDYPHILQTRKTVRAAKVAHLVYEMLYQPGTPQNNSVLRIPHAWLD